MVNEKLKKLLELFDKDGEGGYSAFSIDPNERRQVMELCNAIEALRGEIG
jgi:hypothetical protein